MIWTISTGGTWELFRNFDWFRHQEGNIPRFWAWYRNIL